jgi:HSP20 family protein
MTQSQYPVARSANRSPWSGQSWNDWFNGFGFPFPSFFERNLTTGVSAPVDVCERDNEFIVRMACAGCRPEDIDVTVEGDTIRIRGKFMDHEMGQQGQSMNQSSGQQSTQQSSQQTNQQSGQSMTQQGGRTGMQTGNPQSQGENCLIRELPTGRFERDIMLPTEINAQQAHANFEYGLLTLHLPKAQSAQGHKIQIGQHSGTSSSSGSNVNVGTGAR